MRFARLKPLSVFFCWGLLAAWSSPLRAAPLREITFKPGDVKFLPNDTTLHQDATPEAPIAYRANAGERVRILSLHESVPWAWVELMRQTAYGKKKLSGQGWVPTEALEDSYEPPLYRQEDLLRYQELSQLAKLQRYALAGMDYRIGTGDLRTSGGELLQSYRSWGFASAGAGWGIRLGQSKAIILLEPFFTAHYESVRVSTRPFYSFSLGFMSRYLFEQDESFALGPIVGVLYNLSTFPDAEIPLEGNKHSLRFPVGATLSYALPANIGALFFELFYEFGTFSSLGLGLKVAVSY